MAGGDNFAFMVESYISLNAEAPSFVPHSEISIGSSSLKNVDLILAKSDVETGTDTQVRCMEKAKGGIKYDLVLVKPPLKVRKRPPGRKSAFSVKEIPGRLGTMEDHSAVSDTHQMDSIIDNKEKDDTYDSLIKKTESSKESREACLKSAQDKARDKVMKTLEDKKYSESLHTKDLVMDELVKKIETAIMNERKMYSTLKERLEKIEQINKDLITRVENLQDCKCSQLSAEPAKNMMQQIRMKLAEHETSTSEVMERIRKKKFMPKSERAVETFSATTI